MDAPFAIELAANEEQWPNADLRWPAGSHPWNGSRHLNNTAIIVADLDPDEALPDNHDRRPEAALTA